MSISILVLAKDEQDLIADCLKQFSFAKEIIVLDQNSQDRTAEIAKKYATKILSTTEEDFSKNRNTLLKNSNSDWVLYVDCDERLSDESINEIKNATKSARFAAYYIPRKNLVLGKWLKHGGWSPDYVPKLFLKEKLVKWEGRVHESPIVNGKFGHFKNPITHHTARSLSQMLAKTIKWAKIEAELSFESKHPRVNIAKTIKSMIMEFTSRFIIKLGFLDGRVGLIEAIFQSLHKAAIFTYLWELQNDTKEKLRKLKNE